ncbi:MAG: hypothetical protein PHS83_04945 [Clostridia bacterium]|nr:hypothetical protein [Clostridia bacterium]MDD4665903.1 hypothetical protein [Clostridia bacterium]
MGLRNKLNRLVKGGDKSIVEQIERDAANLDRDKLMERIGETDNRRSLSGLTEERLCETAEWENGYFTDCDVEIVNNKIKVKETPKEKDFVIIGNIDLPHSDAEMWEEVKPRAKREVLSSSLNADKQVFPEGTEVYTSQEKEKGRKSLGDIEETAKAAQEKYIREIHPDGTVVEVNRSGEKSQKRSGGGREL